VLSAWAAVAGNRGDDRISIRRPSSCGRMTASPRAGGDLAHALNGCTDGIDISAYVLPIRSLRFEVAGR
jgi:hypothetical protein